MTAPAISQNFSGVLIDQNADPRTALPITDESTYYQTFVLPESVERGELQEVTFPALSGFQVLLGIAERPEETKFSYTFEQYLLGSGWQPFFSGTVEGAPFEGEKVWIDVLFDEPFEVTASMVASELREEAPTEFRIALSFENRVTKLWYVTPNPPTVHGEALRDDEKYLLFPETETIEEEGIKNTRPKAASLNFRVLGLIADSGTDFLGNPYRSTAIISDAASAGAEPNAGYWLSAPQPSQFAVVSHYSDLRPFPTTPKYGTINLIENPNFEYDLLPIYNTETKKWEPRAPYAWIPKGEATLSVNRWRGNWNELEVYSEGEGVQRLKEETTLTYVSKTNENRANDPITDEEVHWELRAGQFEPVKGSQYLEVNTGAVKRGVQLSSENEVPVKIGVPYTFSFWMRRSVGAEDAKINVVFGGTVTVGSTELKIETIKEEWTKYELTFTPKETGKATVTIENTNGKPIFFLDVLQVNVGKEATKYVDGDVISCVWNGAKGRSSSSELVEKESKNEEVVVDSVLIDPITPGVGFNIYYTNDLTGSEEGEPTIEQWEQKLWIHVPQTYVTAGRTTYVLPKPIAAKFIKIEFTNLQARPYDPGDFQTPVRFKEFPDYISEVFLSLNSTPTFVVNKVGVTYDKLELMYNYYLNDLHQAPVSPLLSPPKNGPALDVVDPTTLGNIKQVINTYTEPTAARANRNTLLGGQQSAEALQNKNSPVEAEPAYQGRKNLPVSSLDRNNVVFDQNMPVMFFYITCRHEYKEILGNFAEKKAYFAGLKALAFIRQSYSTTYDGELYLEAGADDVNTNRQDFVVENDVWYTN